MKTWGCSLKRYVPATWAIALPEPYGNQTSELLIKSAVTPSPPLQVGSPNLSPPKPEDIAAFLSEASTSAASFNLIPLWTYIAALHVSGHTFSIYHSRWCLGWTISCSPDAYASPSTSFAFVPFASEYQDRCMPPTRARLKLSTRVSLPTPTLPYLPFRIPGPMPPTRARLKLSTACLKAVSWPQVSCACSLLVVTESN